MNKAKLAEVLAERTGHNKKQVEHLLDMMTEIIEDTLASGEEVTLAGFGTFMAKFRSARMGVNPQNPSERISIHSVTVPKFKAGKRLKDKLKETTQAATPSTPEDINKNTAL